MNESRLGDLSAYARSSKASRISLSPTVMTNLTAPILFVARSTFEDSRPGEHKAIAARSLSCERREQSRHRRIFWPRKPFGFRSRSPIGGQCETEPKVDWRAS